MRQTGGSHTGYHPFLLDICCVNGLADAFRGLRISEVRGKNSEPPSTLLFYTLVTCGFVAKKVGLVGGTQFFTALPKTAVSQYEKRLHNSGLMDKCGLLPYITVRLWNLSPTSRSQMV